MEKKDRKPDSDDEKERQEQMARQMRYGITYILVGLVVLWLFQQFVLGPLTVRALEIPYSEFRQKLADGDIVRVEISPSQIRGEMKNPDFPGDVDAAIAAATVAPAAATTVDPTATGVGIMASQPSTATLAFDTFYQPENDPNLVEDLQAAGVAYRFTRPASPIGAFLLSWILPLALLAGFWFLLFRARSGAGPGMGGGGLGNIFGVGKSKAQEVKPEDVGVTYKDVGGADEAIQELQEIIQFLKSPEQFAKLGGRIPKGVLLVGPPGTGKTLLAKATAGEAGVSFFETSGSEFVEMFVGVGAARVRDLFEQARKAAPAVIFIDEIDAIGASRGNNIRIGGNDEREQTLNQLLAEIDGFKTNTTAPVIIMAATNRPEVLDQALLRAGRFDRQVTVGNPDVVGRQQILRIHSKNVKLDPDFDIERAARMTPGFSGADLANIMNEAALLAARRNADFVMIRDFEAAIERIVAGLEQRTKMLNEDVKRAVAYHEAGHALVMMGGRAAETIIYNEISTGASDDINRATDLARRMVTEWGMSEKLGWVRYAGQGLQYLGGVMDDNASLSPETREAIDSEVKRIVTEQVERAQAILTQHRDALEMLTEELLRCETVDGSAVAAAVRGEKRECAN